MPLFIKNEVSIYYELDGAGFPLLLLPPGGIVATIDFWQKTAFNGPQIFPQWFRTISLDERNSGGSSVALDYADPWGSYAADHIGLLDHLGIERCHILGCCIGASHVLRLLRDYPNRFVAAALVQPIGNNRRNNDVMQNIWKRWAAVVVDQGAISREDAERFAIKMWSGDFVLSVEREDLSSIKTPTLVLPGIDEAHPGEIAHELAALAVASEILEPWKAPSRCIPPAIRRIRSFFDQHTPPDWQA